MRSPFPLKKGEGMIGKAFVTDTQRARFLHSAGFALLGRNDKDGIILRDPFDCAAHILFAAPLRVTGIGATRAARPFLSSRPSEASGGILYRAESRVEHGSILAFPLGGRCHAGNARMTEEGSGVTYRRTPLFSRLRRQLPPKGEAEVNGRANCLS